jgi:hypothetical protein
MESKNEDFKELMNIGQNIYNLYRQLVLCRNQEEKKKTLEHLELALEYEAKQYRNLPYQKALKISNLLSFLPGINILLDIEEIHPLNMPLYRIWYDITKIITSSTEVSVEPNDWYANEYLEALKKDIQEEEETMAYLDEKMILIYLNLLKRQKQKKMNLYYDILFLTPSLERLLIQRRLNVPTFDEIENFLLNHKKTALSQSIESQFSMNCKDNLIYFWKSLFESNQEPHLDKKAYLHMLTCYSMISIYDLKDFLNELEVLLLDKKLSKEKRNLLVKFLKDIEKLEKENIKVKKRNLEY